jgi:exodeoxyribonuclease VII small subunit
MMSGPGETDGLGEGGAAFEHDDAPSAAPATSDPAETPSSEIAAMSFEEALAELEAIVQKLERGQLDLDSAIRAYERGTELRQHCAGKLREAELRVEKLSFDRNRNPRLEPLGER